MHNDPLRVVLLEITVEAPVPTYQRHPQFWFWAAVTATALFGQGVATATALLFGVDWAVIPMGLFYGVAVASLCRLMWVFRAGHRPPPPPPVPLVGDDPATQLHHKQAG